MSMIKLCAFSFINWELLDNYQFFITLLNNLQLRRLYFRHIISYFQLKKPNWIEFSKKKLERKNCPRLYTSGNDWIVIDNITRHSQTGFSNSTHMGPIWVLLSKKTNCTNDMVSSKSNLAFFIEDILTTYK